LIIHTYIDVNTEDIVMTSFVFNEDDTKERKRRRRRRPSIKKVEFDIKNANHLYIWDDNFK